MEDFTNEERTRLDILYSSDFKGELSSDDVKLISKFENFKITQRKTADETSENNINEMRQLNSECQNAYNDAMSILNELQARALARLERFDNGK